MLRRLGVIPGIVSLTAGPREKSQDRPANERRFDVALTIVFDSVDALEEYLAHPTHLSIVEDYSPRIESLRVFDWRLTE